MVVDQLLDPGNVEWILLDGLDQVVRQRNGFRPEVLYQPECRKQQPLSQALEQDPRRCDSGCSAPAIRQREPHSGSLGVRRLP